MLYSSADNTATGNCSKESIDSNMSIDFENSQLLDEYLSGKKQDETNSQSVFDNVDIENELNMFDPEQISSSESILEYWNSVKSEHKHLYELAKCIYA